MRYPKLVQKRYCKTPIHVIINGEGLSDDGSSVILFEKDLFCNYQEKPKQILDAEKKVVQINATALFSDNLAEGIASISSGEVIVFGKKREIFSGSRKLNPDGTVNFCEMEFK